MSYGLKFGAHVRWKTPTNIGSPLSPTCPPLSRCSESGRIKAQSSTIRTASLRAAITPRIIQAHLSRLGALEACKAAAQLLLHTDTRAIALQATGCIAVRVVDTCKAAWAGLKLTSTATAADLDFLEHRLGCWTGELSRGGCASGGLDGCGEGGFRRRSAGLRLLIAMSAMISTAELT